MSPRTVAVDWISRRSLAVMSPVTWPCTATDGALDARVHDRAVTDDEARACGDLALDGPFDPAPALEDDRPRDAAPLPNECGRLARLPKRRRLTLEHVHLPDGAPSAPFFPGTTLAVETRARLTSGQSSLGRQRPSRSTSRRAGVRSRPVFSG